MKFKIQVLVILFLPVIISSCGSGEHKEKQASAEAGSEHAASHPEGGSEESGEESGEEYGIDYSYEGVRNGVKMVLSFDKESTSFTGTVENVTEKEIEKVRVEVHLSNGIELGPTSKIDLKPGETAPVSLDATGQEFERWSTHAESGSNEHGGAGVGEGEHSSNEEGEHDGEEGEHK